jgi:hypothetical protein
LAISVPGLSVSLLLLLCIISIISAVQASFIHSPVRITNREEVSQEKITDQIFSTQAQAEEVQLISTQQNLARVATFPLENNRKELASERSFNYLFQQLSPWN